jgi:hypothetical protein
MKHPITFLLGVAITLLLFGCSTPEQSSVSGKRPIAHGALYRQAEQAVISKDRELAADCQARSVAKREMFRAPLAMVTARATAPEPITGMYTPAPSVPAPVETQYSEFVEKWTVNRCGQEIAYLVTFTPAMSGGSTVVVVSPAP